MGFTDWLLTDQIAGKPVCMSWPRNYYHLLTGCEGSTVKIRGSEVRHEKSG